MTISNQKSFARPQIAILLGALLMPGCASSPSTETVASFGGAAGQTVTILADNARLSADLSNDTALLKSSCQYLRTGKISLSPYRSEESFGTINEQAKFIGALGKYADALAGSVDQEDLTKLKTAAAGLASASGGLVSAIPGTSAPSSVVGSGVRFLLNVIVNVSELRRRHQIRAIASEVEPSLVDGSNLILNDAETIREVLLSQIAQWEAQAKCNLHAIQRNQSSSHKLYVDFVDRKNEYLVRISMLDRGVAAMGKLLLTHQKLVEGGPDVEIAIAEFNSLVADITALKNALETK